MRRARKFASNPPGDLRSPCWPFKTLSSGWNMLKLPGFDPMMVSLVTWSAAALSASVGSWSHASPQPWPKLWDWLKLCLQHPSAIGSHTICVNLSWCSPLQIPDAACIWSFNPSKPILVVKMFKGMRPLLRTTRAAPREQQGRCWASTAVSHVHVERTEELDIFLSFSSLGRVPELRTTDPFSQPSTCRDVWDEELQMLSSESVCPSSFQPCQPCTICTICTCSFLLQPYHRSNEFHAAWSQLNTHKLHMQDASIPTCKSVYACLRSEAVSAKLYTVAFLISVQA